MPVPKIVKRIALAVGILASAILAVMALVAIPNVSQMRMTGNETSALKTLDTLRNACLVYVTDYGSYPKDLTQLGPPQGRSHASIDGADLIDLDLTPSGGAPAVKDGYAFRYVAGTPDSKGVIVSYSIYADPTSYSNTGVKRFFMDQTIRIRFTTDNSEPSAASRLLGE